MNANNQRSLMVTYLRLKIYFFNQTIEFFVLKYVNIYFQYKLLHFGLKNNATFKKFNQKFKLKHKNEAKMFFSQDVYFSV